MVSQALEMATEGGPAREPEADADPRVEPHATIAPTEPQLPVPAGGEEAQPAPAADQQTTQETPALGDITPVRDAALLGHNRDPRGSLLGAGVVSALLGHACLAAAILFFPDPRAGWSGGGEEGGIDVDVISNRQLDGTTFARARAAAADLAPQPPKPADEPTATPERTGLIRPTLTPESDLDPIEAAPAIDMPQLQAEDRTEPREQPVERRPPRPLSSTPPVEVSEAARADVDRELSAAGGAKRAGDASSATVTARQGEIAEYNRRMVEAIDRCKPRETRGGRGTVWITYVVDVDGSIDRAFVDQSSGSRVLDELAIEALRSCRFDAPLQGLPRSMRFYRISYTFK